MARTYLLGGSNEIRQNICTFERLNVHRYQTPSGVWSIVETSLYSFKASDVYSKPVVYVEVIDPTGNVSESYNGWVDSQERVTWCNGRSLSSVLRSARMIVASRS
jgi:hypothetical protein